MAIKKKETKSNIENFYEHPKVKKYLKKINNPSYEKTGINLCARTLIIGGSGAGKTNWLMNYLKCVDNIFAKIIIVSLGVEEPFYEFLRDELSKKGKIEFYTLEKFPSMKKLIEEKEDDQHYLIIYDDIINECKNDKNIKNYFIAGRKNNLQQMFLSQSFYDIPKLLRQQMTYLVLLKLSGDRDTKLILKDFQLGITKDELIEMYKDATSEKLSCLFVDMLSTDPNKKFSKSFVNYYEIEE